MAYTLEELSVKIDGIEKMVDNHSSKIDTIEKDIPEIKGDIKDIKSTNSNMDKILTKLDNDREERLKSEGKQWSSLKIAIVTAFFTSIAGGFGAYILAEIIK